MNFAIRKMHHTDTKQVQDVAKKTWHATYEGIIPLEVQNTFLQSAYNDERMKQRLEHSFLFVADINGRVVGFANFSPVKEDGQVELGAIYLYPEYQGKGIGSALLHQGITDIAGISEIYINVEKENKIGKTFYEAKGFEVVKEFDEDFQGHTLKTVQMVLKIN